MADSNQKKPTVAKKKPFHEVVAEKLIEQLKAGTAPWQMPWTPGQPNTLLPTNAATGKRYKGINAIHLMAQGRDDSRWMTYKQASAEGAQVRKGERGTAVQYWKFTEQRDKLDEQGKPVFDAEGEKVKETVRLERPRVFTATVFNAEQIDGLPPLVIKPQEEQQWSPIERAENILQASGADINHTAGNRAFYRPSTDSITLPEKRQFETADQYYATALHELGHWTGHPSRLDRDLAHPFGSEAYAKEELRAEISSMILGDELGIGHDPGQHVAYVASWIKALEDDPLEIFRAASDAEKIQDYVLAFEQVQEQEQEQVKSQEQQEGPEMEIKANLLGKYTPEVSGVIEEVALATQQFKAGEIGSDVLQEKTTTAFGVKLPDDWSGEIRTVGVVEREGELFMAQEGDTPDSYQVFARKTDVAYPEDQFELVSVAQSEAAAVELADQLKLVGALSVSDEHLQAMQLAAIQEEQVARDPNSTQEDLSAAREARVTAETNMVLNDADIQRRVAEHEKQEQQQKGPEKSQAQKEPQERKYINVPFREKDEAKALGAKWDRKEQSWYVPPSVEVAAFAKWDKPVTPEMEAKRSQVNSKPAQDQQKTYLAVPYTDRAEAKAAGAKWDKAAKSWFADENSDMPKLEKWRPENVTLEHDPAMTPREEFALAMQSIGLVAEGEHPIMDGQRHRVPVQDGKQGALDGFYVGHLDGHPAGRIINNKSGADIKWKSKGYSLSDEERAKIQAEAAAKKEMRAAAIEKAQEATAARVEAQSARFIPIDKPTPYLEKKGVQAHLGALTDQEGKTTFIPVCDKNGKQWSMQYIQEDGTKRFAKDSRKEGCFHAVGGHDALAAAPALVIAEGYATAASLSEALGQATVAAFDAGNLPSVAVALHEKYPDKPIIIAGDDDLKQERERKDGKNPGRIKAEEAALAVGGKAIFPVFAPGEQDSDMSRFTDFNDLATNSSLGKEAVKRQAGAAISKALELSEKKKLELNQVQERSQTTRRGVKM